MLTCVRFLATKSHFQHKYKSDEWTTVTNRIFDHVGANLYLKECHPLSFVRERIVNFFYDRFKNARGNPLFSIFDHLDPCVTIQQNFDNLLIPEDHVSRSKSDCYYLNRQYLLRGHMTAHQVDLIRSGLDNFLMIGDVYRRDEIDHLHYPVFHQIDGVRLLHQLDIDSCSKQQDPAKIYQLHKSDKYSFSALYHIENELKLTLMDLAKQLFSHIENLEIRWVPATFAFTDPSWELEVKVKEKWVELLGCGVIQKRILDNCGVMNRIGWAFGLGLERIAMCLYSIPDIRLFWSNDSGFLNQFQGKHCNSLVTYKPISQYPQCFNDMSFWVSDAYSDNDFYDLVRNVGGNYVEQVQLKDQFRHPKNGMSSKCFRITYRHMEKTLTKEEVNKIHAEIEKQAEQFLNIKIR